MVEKKNSFLMYYEYEEQLSILSDEDLGKLMRAIFRYEKEKIMPNFSGVLQIAFLFIKGNLDRDMEKYDKRCETSAINGKKGGRPRKEKPKQKPNSKPKPNLKKPKKADNDIDNDNENEIDNDSDSDNDIDIDNENAIDIDNEKVNAFRKGFGTYDS